MTAQPARSPGWLANSRRFQGTYESGHEMILSPPPGCRSPRQARRPAGRRSSPAGRGHALPAARLVARRRRHRGPVPAPDVRPDTGHRTPPPDLAGRTAPPLPNPADRRPDRGRPRGAHRLRRTAARGGVRSPPPPHRLGVRRLPGRPRPRPPGPVPAVHRRHPRRPHPGPGPDDLPGRDRERRPRRGAARRRTRMGVPPPRPARPGRPGVRHPPHLQRPRRTLQPHHRTGCRPRHRAGIQGRGHPR